jgi:hypothetical protein
MPGLARQLKLRANFTKSACADYLKPKQSAQADFVTLACGFIRPAVRAVVCSTWHDVCCHGHVEDT